MKTQKYLLEIRASEGGDDSKLLVEDLFDMYIRYVKTNNLDYKIGDCRSGYASI
jgi:protein subunit release factor A